LPTARSILKNEACAFPRRPAAIESKCSAKHAKNAPLDTEIRVFDQLTRAQSWEVVVQRLEKDREVVKEKGKRKEIKRRCRARWTKKDEVS